MKKIFEERPYTFYKINIIMYGNKIRLFLRGQKPNKENCW